MNPETITDTKASMTVTDNYIDVKYEYFGVPDDNGLRLRTRDVWYATKPTVPEFHIVDNQDHPIPEFQADVTTSWTINKAGIGQVIIHDRDDINGLRALLDELEKDFDRRDMEALHASLLVSDEDDEENEDEG